jgi:hypothetical protein
MIAGILNLQDLQISLLSFIFRSMVEQYYDFCVPIFPAGNNWTCHFVNTQSVSYLVTFEDRPENQPPCCVFENPWYPPAPNFVEIANNFDHLHILHFLAIRFDIQSINNFERERCRLVGFFE